MRTGTPDLFTLWGGRHALAACAVELQCAAFACRSLCVRNVSEMRLGRLDMRAGHSDLRVTVKAEVRNRCRAGCRQASTTVKRARRWQWPVCSERVTSEDTCERAPVGALGPRPWPVVLVTTVRAEP
eukprot:4564930-Prymnesium_polylepis.1